MGFPGGSDSKESALNAGNLGSIPGLGRSPGGGIGNPFQYSCLGNPTGRGAWQAIVHGVAKVSDATEHARKPSLFSACAKPAERLACCELLSALNLCS